MPTTTDAVGRDGSRRHEPIVISGDNEGTEVPDDDDVQLIGESRNMRESRITRHLPPRDLHRLFKEFRIAQPWDSIGRDPRSGIRIGDVVTLSDERGFLQIRELLIHGVNSNILVIRGVRFQRLDQMFPSIRIDSPEVIMIQEVFPQSSPSEDDLYLENFTIKDIVIGRSSTIERWRLRFTNIPLHSPDEQTARKLLICRAKYVIQYAATQSGLSRVTKEMWLNLRDSECNTRFSMSDRRLRREQRRARGGSLHTPSADQSYTACDGFCGAGFASVGAKSAEFKVVWAFDRDQRAMQSYSLNHRDVRHRLRMDFFDVLRVYGASLRGVDLLMLSFPCQFFSPAHTVAGRNDEMNEAILFGLHEFLKETQPRVVVIEQTFGLNMARFRLHLMQVIAALRENNYSIGKAVINFAGLGEASERRRLIIIGAAAGEALPPFPRQLFNINFNNPDLFLLPAVSVYDRLRLVVGNHPEHIPYVTQRLRHPQRSYDPERTKMKTQTCSRSKDDGHSVHWSGRRLYTIHELALLQGGSKEMRFVGTLTEQARQVGNAFPSIAAGEIYKMVMKSLKRADDQDRQKDLIDPVVLAGSSAEHAISL